MYYLLLGSDMAIYLCFPVFYIIDFYVSLRNLSAG
ncbi:Uncharacterised protein [Pannonibacter phragmitetus]|uniref:Uncharacterized protein n=1 Tax=Pannonibacter phragmitetus TaxID=121719 RepID=A0A378ZXJ1_9HYPH|nr:Uncharacterised protein [Pannonibacter phragmitetus]